MFKLINIWAYCYLLTSVGLTILKAPAPKLENFWAYYTANSVAILTHKLWQNFIYPLWDHTWNMELKFGTHIYTVKDTHWKKFSSLDYGSVWGTGTRATKTYDIFQLPSLENWRVFLSLSTFFKIAHNLIYFPVNFHPTRLSSCLRINNIVFLLHLCINFHRKIKQVKACLKIDILMSGSSLRVKLFLRSHKTEL